MRGVFVEVLGLVVYVTREKEQHNVFFLLCPQVDEWRGRASRFLSLCEDIAQLHCSVVGGNNRAVLYDLYPYVWDLRNTALVAKAFICWLGKDRSNILLYYHWTLHWFDLPCCTRMCHENEAI